MTVRTKRRAVAPVQTRVKMWEEEGVLILTFSGNEPKGSDLLDRLISVRQIHDRIALGFTGLSSLTQQEFDALRGFLSSKPHTCRAVLYGVSPTLETRMGYEAVTGLPRRKDKQEALRELNS